MNLRHDQRGLAATNYALVAVVATAGLGALLSLGTSMDNVIAGSAGGERSSVAGAGAAGGGSSSNTHIELGNVYAAGTDSHGGGSAGSGKTSELFPSVPSFIDLVSGSGSDGALGLRSSAYAGRVSGTVEAPGRLPHDVDPGFYRKKPAQQQNVLNKLDRESWTQNPDGDKPVAAWTYGDAVGALIDDHMLPPEEGLFSVLEDSFLGTWFDFDADESSDSAPPTLYPGLSDFGNIRQLEYEGDPSSPKALRERLAELETRETKLRKRLKALRAFGEAGIAGVGPLRTDVRDQLTATEDLQVYLELQLGMKAWDGEHGDRDLDSDALEEKLGPLDAQGPLADARDLYFEEVDGDAPSPEELLLSIVGTKHHDASVQSALLEREGQIEDQIDALEAELGEGGTSLGSLTPSLERHARELNGSRRALRTERNKLAKQRAKLLKAHNKQHAKGEREGLSNAEWKAYQAREKKIRALTKQMNKLAARDGRLGEDLRAFNQLVGDAGIAGYTKVKNLDTLKDASNPSFFSNKPEPGFVYPVKGSPGISSYFGEIASYRSGPHTGVDFPVGTGTPLHAAQRGKVVWVGSTGAFGNSVTIRHPDGSATSYSHLSTFSVSMGETVDRDEVIGLSGMTGNITGPHLHFEYYPPGRTSSTPGYGNSANGLYQQSTDPLPHLH